MWISEYTTIDKHSIALKEDEIVYIEAMGKEIKVMLKNGLFIILDTDFNSFLGILEMKGETS